MLMNFTSKVVNSRLWEIRVTQVPFSQRAPSDCLQYFTEPEGVLQTFNFAENGRHLAGQNYKACFRQNTGMCSIAYEPCNENSFRIGPSDPNSFVESSGISSGGAVDPLSGAEVSLADPAVGGDLQDLASSDTASVSEDAPVDLNDEVEGSGGGTVADLPEPPAFGGFPSFNSLRDIFFSFRSMRAMKRRRQQAVEKTRQLYSTCTDRITMPCIIEDFMTVGMGEVPSCVPVHCGTSLCPTGLIPCRLESSVTPFRIGIRFGEGRAKGSPEDNIGACLRYSQVKC